MLAILPKFILTLTICTKKLLPFSPPFNSFTAQSEEGKDKKETYTYVFQVCGDADGMKDAGVVQKDKDGKQVLIGNYNKTQVVKGSE